MSVIDKTNAPYLRNAWWVAAWADELDNGMLGRTIMDEPIVLFRDASGKVGAVEDRCCHRGARLTDGKVVETGLQCGYHGLVFDVNGKCVDIPGQASIPPQANIKSYPLVEQNKILWIWMGDPALADPKQIPRWDYHDQPDKWPHGKTMMPIKANYMMMIDNLMDLTHLGYVHTKTIGGNPLTHVNAKMDTEYTDTGVKWMRWMLDVAPPPTYVKAVGFKGKIDRWQEFEYVVPGVVLQWSGALDVGKGAQQNREQDGFHLKLLHAITPATENTSYYFWSGANGYRQHDPQATVDLYNELYPTFVEDVDIMAGQQARIDRDPDRPLVAIRADGALNMARRKLRDALEAEQNHRAAAE